MNTCIGSQRQVDILQESLSCEVRKYKPYVRSSEDRCEGMHVAVTNSPAIVDSCAFVLLNLKSYFRIDVESNSPVERIKASHNEPLGRSARLAVLIATASCAG